MKLKLTNNELEFKLAAQGEPSIIKLPSGTYNIRLNKMTGIKENWFCHILDEKGPTVHAMVGFLGIMLCGDAIATCIEMEYDLTKTEDLKKIKKQDKVKIKARYHELLTEKPELFDSDNIDYSVNIETEEIGTEDVGTEDVDISGYFYRELNTSKTRAYQVCVFCEEWHKKDPGLGEIANDWGYSAHGNIYNDMVGDDIYIRSENEDRHIHTYHLFSVTELTFLGIVPKHTGNIQICDNCDEVIRGKHEVDELFFYISHEDKIPLNDIYKMAETDKYSEFVNDIFNPPSLEIIDLIYSKFSVIPEKLETSIKEMRADKDEIINLLKEKGSKITTADIAAMLKKKNIKYIKYLCEELFDDGEINFAGNNRYFILNENKSSNSTSPSSIESKNESESVDIKKELKKFKDLLDEGLIDEDDYNAKKSELLGL